MTRSVSQTNWLAGDFCARFLCRLAGGRENGAECGRLPRDSGDLAGLHVTLMMESVPLCFYSDV